MLTDDFATPRRRAVCVKLRVSAMTVSMCKSGSAASKSRVLMGLAIVRFIEHCNRPPVVLNQRPRS
jgi:hypothetical protein